MATGAGENVTYEFGQFRLDPAERLLVRDGQAVPSRRRPSICWCTSSSVTAAWSRSRRCSVIQPIATNARARKREGVAPADERSYTVAAAARTASTTSSRSNGRPKISKIASERSPSSRATLALVLVMMKGMSRSGDVVRR
jgi:hypothetical protein